MHRARRGRRRRHCDVRLQVVHGDAWLGNVLRTPDGPVWSDFERLCLGPRELDLACNETAARPRPDVRRTTRSWRGTATTTPPCVDGSQPLELVPLTAWTYQLAATQPDVSRTSHDTRLTWALEGCCRRPDSPCRGVSSGGLACQSRRPDREGNRDHRHRRPRRGRHAGRQRVRPHHRLEGRLPRGRRRGAQPPHPPRHRHGRRPRRRPPGRRLRRARRRRRGAPPPRRALRAADPRDQRHRRRRRAARPAARARPAAS